MGAAHPIGGSDGREKDAHDRRLARPDDPDSKRARRSSTAAPARPRALDTLICGLIDLHQTMIDDMVEEGDEQEKINAWAIDLSKLHIVQELLDSVKL